MNGSYTAAERAHVRRVKELPCSVCRRPGPSHAHHIEQGLHYCTVSLCYDCHQDETLGWHGARVNWTAAKMEPLDALNQTIGWLVNPQGRAALEVVIARERAAATPAPPASSSGEQRMATKGLYRPMREGDQGYDTRAMAARDPALPAKRVKQTKKTKTRKKR